MILDQGRNCWRVATAERAAFLIDGAAYYDALRAALERAQREVFIVGWDIDSRARLGPDEHTELLPFLNRLLRRRRELHVHVLTWDFSVIYTLEREALPSYLFARRGHRRLSFRLDGLHPLMASHHQKLVTIDGRLAFSGGVDLTTHRWDTPEHAARHPRRVDPLGHHYPPMHDVQMAVDGDAAAALHELARARWLRASGATTPARVEGARPRRAGDPDPWPPELQPDVRDAPVGIARTQPALDEEPPIHEVLTLTLDTIAAARRFIYLENQYLTSAAVGHALAQRLAEPDGPEIVAVVPREQVGWLEQRSMGVMRARLIERLRAADHHSRLRLLYPTVPGLGEAIVNVHSKVMVVDDTIARVGSANLSNRSMGLDTECDLVIDASADGAGPEVGRAVATFRNRLLAEHLGTTPETVAARLGAGGSLIGMIDSLRGGPRSLEPLPVPTEAAQAPGIDFAFGDGLVSDPERPSTDLLIAELVPLERRRFAFRSLLGWVLGLGAVVALAALWRFTSLRAMLDIERLARLGQALATDPAAPLFVLGAYLVGAAVLFPITIMLTATAIIFSPGHALAYGLGGALAGAALTFGIGRLVGRFRPRWLERPRVQRLRRALERRGVVAIIAVRLLPVGNFTLINVVAGAMGVRFLDFMIGCAVGLLPGLLAITLLADRLGSALRSPRLHNLALLVAVAAVFVVVLLALRKVVGRALRSHERRHG